MRVLPKLTWRPEFYFISSVIRTPRYASGVTRPHILFGNESLLCIWRMIEQAILLRGKDDPLLDSVTFEEVSLTAEYQRATTTDVKGLWPQLSDATIKGSPEKFHKLLEYYAAARLIDQKICNRMQALTDGTMSPEDAVTGMQEDVVSVYTNGNYQPTTVRSLISNIWEERADKPRVKIRTGFPKLDNVVGALVPGCTYLWAARTSHGKSSWAGQIVSQQAIMGHRVGVIGLEDSRSVWASRWLSRVSGVQLKKIRDNILSAPSEGSERLSGTEEVALEESTKTSHLDNICLVDGKGGRLFDVLRMMNDLVVRHKCEIVWIDYLQAIYAEARDSRSRRDFLEYCWAMLEREAERLNVPLMITAQLNRSWEVEPISIKPGLRHVEWMGAAEQKAYVGAIIYRPYKDPRLNRTQQENRFNELIVNVEKSKQGESVALKYHFDPGACVIREV
jgi:replicative DNA helicase